MESSHGRPHASSDRPFASLLFVDAVSEPIVGIGTPAFFSDLNLDQVVEAITTGREERDLLTALFSRGPDSQETVRFRQEIFRDLRDPALHEAAKSFSAQMHDIRAHLAQCEKMGHRHQRNGWFLSAAASYCESVQSLAGELTAADIRSPGLLAFREFLSAYAASTAFSSLVADTGDRQSDLARVRYCVRIRGSRVEVSRYEGEPDYSAEIQETFERFRQGPVKDYRLEYRVPPGMNHVAAQILDRVARLFGDELSALDDYSQRHDDLVHETIRRFDRDLQFYLSYLNYIEPLEAAGLRTCLPDVSDRTKEIFARDTFDIALANKLVAAATPVVVNEIRMDGAERIFVVSGPNQGGKTTFARTFGQLHYLASIGCPVPGSAARLFLFDQLHTHFGREEELATLQGRLEEDLVRIRDTLASATPDSIVIMNEIFTSTTLSDARFLGRKVLEAIAELDLLCVFVTFVEELASLGPSVVSMVSTIAPNDPAVRTFAVVRAPADGLAYALAIAAKHGLGYEALRRRIAS